MCSKLINILLFEDNPGDVLLIKEALKESTLASFNIVCVERLSDGLAYLEDGKVDIILLDLALLDSLGIDTFNKVKSKAKNIPLVVSTSNNDDSLALETIKGGGQDYIIKGQMDRNTLARSIMYAIERHRIKVRLTNLSFLDELTGLCNRRGFYNIAEQHIKLAQRITNNLLVIYADLDGMKQINDISGHIEGDLALTETANILKMTFRESDVIARIGGDEFAIIALEADKTDVYTIRERLRKNIDDWYAKANYSFKLSISIGIAYYDYNNPCSIDELLHEADKMMYQEKRNKNIS
jgi:diguanylate cyclase (GGDEF)-like protein